MSSLRTIVAVFLDRSYADQAVDELHAAGFRPGQIEVLPGGNELSDDPLEYQRVIINVQAGDASTRLAKSSADLSRMSPTKISDG